MRIITPIFCRAVLAGPDGWGVLACVPGPGRRAGRADDRLAWRGLQPGPGRRAGRVARDAMALRDGALGAMC